VTATPRRKVIISVKLIAAVTVGILGGVYLTSSVNENVGRLVVAVLMLGCLIRVQRKF
jgi:hypothetical protein